MPQQIMYPGKVNSPQTELASAIDDEQTTIPLLDASVLPDPPNICTIGIGEDAETVLYTGKSGNNLTGVTRGFQGAAKAWNVGAKVARYFTAYDHDAFRQNIEEAQATANTHASRHAAGGPDEITPVMIGAASQADFAAHLADNTNPHNVTKAQVGLGNVQNYGIATQAQAEAGTANNVYMTPLRVAQAIAALSPGIKSVQRGSGTIPFDSQTVNVTISTINRNKAFVIAYSRGSTNEFYHQITAELTSNTNLRITRGDNNVVSTPFTWEVVEFN